MVGTKEQTNENQDTANFSVALHSVFAVDLRHALSADRKRSRAEYCPRSRCLGRWFRVERRLRHSRQGWLQGKYRPGAGDIVQRRPISWRNRRCSTQLTISKQSSLRRRGEANQVG